MALEQLTIITPENLKSILTTIFNDYTSKLDNKLSVVMAETKNTVTLTANTSTVNIGIAGFDKAKDILHVYKDNVLLENGYSISSDSLSVTFSAAITATAEIPVNIKFIITEASIIVNV